MKMPETPLLLPRPLGPAWHADEATTRLAAAMDITNDALIFSRVARLFLYYTRRYWHSFSSPLRAVLLFPSLGARENVCVQ